MSLRHELLVESIEALERVGCQFVYCDGPTLTPEPMITCYVCDLLARLRHEVGLPPRRDDEMTFDEWDRARYARLMVEAVSR